MFVSVLKILPSCYIFCFMQATEALQNSMIALVDNQKLLDELYNFRVNMKNGITDIFGWYNGQSTSYI